MSNFIEKVVDFENPGEYNLVHGFVGDNGSGGKAIHQNLVQDYSHQYAVKVTIPTVGSSIGTVTMRYKYNNSNSSQQTPNFQTISIRMYVLDANGGILKSKIEEYTGTENAWNTAPSISGSIVNGAATISVHLAILHVENPPSPAGMSIILDTVSYTTNAPGEHSNLGEADCPICTTGQGSIGNPISIRHGEKREEITDISLNSPAGMLALTRSYSQNKQGEFEFMGLGWNHNHLVKLTKITGSPNKIIVRLPRGGEAHFTETTPPDHYDGDVGVGSVVDWNLGTSQYTLTASDKSTYVFDSSGNLLSRSWPNGETWDYSYASGNLSEISDDYGRKLVFRYYASGDHSGQLYRVGDQTFDDTSPTSPTGRYVEYRYTLHKVVDSTGAIVTSSSTAKRSLLTSVFDVRGKEWTYDYYGQDSAETDVRQLNFLIERLSPSVDTTGDGVADGTLSIEDLTYIMQGTELVVNGGMENDSDWASVNSPTTNARSTTQVDSGTYSRHVEASAAGQGIEGNSWNLVAGKTYIVTAKVYPVSGVVKMQVSGETAFDRTSLGTGTWQLLRAVYKPTAAATGKKLQFIASSGAAEFYVDTISLIESDLSVSAITQQRGNSALVTDFAFQPSGENITTEETAGKTITHHFLNGVYAGPEDPAGNYTAQFVGQTYRPELQADANGNETLLRWSSDGKQLQEVVDASGNATAFSYDADLLKTSEDAQNRKTTYMYEANSRQPSLILVSNTANEITGLNGGMEANSGWTDISGAAPATNARVNTQVDSDDHARHVVASTAGQGIEGNTWDLVANQTYTIRARVFPVSGAVKMQVTGETAFDQISAGAGKWEPLTATYTPGSGATGKKLQFVASGGAAEFYVDSISISTSGEIAVNGGMEVDSDWAGMSGASPTTNERSNVRADTGTYSRRVVASAAGQGIEGNSWDVVANQIYTVRARVYPVSGSVKMQVPGISELDVSTAETGSWQTLSAVYASGSNLTGKQLQFVALGGAAEFYVDSVSISTARELATDGSMEAATSGWADISGSAPTTNERLPRVDSGDYMRHVVATGVGQGMESATWDVTANHTYLITARVYVLKNTVNPASVKLQVPSIAGFDKTTTLTNVWETLRVIYTPTSSVTGRRLQFVAAALDNNNRAEFYIDTVHIVDLGVITVSIQDQVRWQEFAYDRMGRTILEASISPANASLIQQVQRSYYASGKGNGLLRQVIQTDVGGSNNVTTTYTYDDAGRVVKTQQSTLTGDCCGTLTEYDSAGNILSTTELRDPTQPNDPVVNPVTAYEYDTLGRRIRVTTDSRTAFWKANLTAYDALNRIVRTISNYKPVMGVSNPYTAARSAFNGEHGTENTENLVTDTAYNARGMVKSQTDVLDNVLLYGYDEAGRLVKTIQSASQPSYNNDYLGDMALSSYVPNSAVDKDIIATQEYDAAGNIIKMVSPLGNLVTSPTNTDKTGYTTLTGYDELNRPVKTIRNASQPGYNISTDPKLLSYTISIDPDKDLVETSEYDSMGRISRIQRLLENRPTAQWETTLFGYDTLGRQVKVIRSASNPTYDIAADPDLSDYGVSSNPDQDIVTKKFYDDKSRVLYTEDALEVRTWIGYDGLGRQVKTIANAVGTATDGGVNDPRSGSYVPSSDPDRDLITVMAYDANGRVQSTQDVLNRVTRNVYDALGRVVRTIANYVAQASTDPADWVWNSSSNRWEYDSGDTTAISHGTDNDQNIITDTVYDDQGRVSQTIDHRQNTTLYVYDVLGRRIKTITNYIDQGEDPALWVWNNGWKQSDGITAISFGTDNDQNRINMTTYDLAGRVTNIRDAAGIETRFTYDALGRRTQTIVNYVNGVYSSAVPDEDLISATTYNKGSQVVTTTDARGTQTAFTYDKAGRRLTVTQAANSPLASVSYTCYDKAGRVQRSIQNWIDNGVSPDAKTGSNWDFVPEHNGTYADRNLITQFDYDLASRRTAITDPLGNLITTTYFKDGQTESIADPKNMVTQYRYDELRRRVRVVQGYVAQASTDPEDWTWDGTSKDWEYQTGNLVAHGTDNDENIIVDVTYDKAGRTTTLRSAAGDATHELDHSISYQYDLLNRRKSLLNPINETWETAYFDTAIDNTVNGYTHVELTDPNGVTIKREFDRGGRLVKLTYGDASDTPDVNFTYDAAGNRVAMIENDGTDDIRKTIYEYDDVRRLSSVDFDINGDGTVVESVGYEYDAGGLRTKLTLPGSLDVVYSYDAKGQLISLTDWDSQKTEFVYDLAQRHIATERDNGLRSRYEHDAAGRLKRLRHTKNFRTLAHFEYEVDQRGNRTQTLEVLPSWVDPMALQDTTIAYDDKSLLTSGSWSNVSSFKESSQITASLKLLFLGDEATLTMGTGPDHSLYDVYLGGSLWQSFDGYAASAGQRDIVITVDVDSRKLQGEGPHLVEIRNRGEKNKTSTGYKLRFKQLVVEDRVWVAQTIKYTYDNLSRLLEARYAPGANAAAVDADLLRRYVYAYDRAGNRRSQDEALNGGMGTTTTYTYNEANQLTSGGVTYDNNGNMTNDGIHSYIWDRANRMHSISHNSVELANFTYDGLGNRVKRSTTFGVTEVRKYLLDIQPQLANVISETVGQGMGGYTLRYVHTPRGIDAMDNSRVQWEWILQDGLGSVREVLNPDLSVQESRVYSPYGEFIETTGASNVNYWFTGEQFEDADDSLYLRARWYRPDLGVFTALDPFEGVPNIPMSLNGYSWVQGNTPNMIDPSGRVAVTGLSCLPSLIRVSLEDPFVQAKCGCYQNIDFAYNACVASISNPNLSSGIVYCDKTNPGTLGCCGPDATKWFHEEISNHMFYMSSEGVFVPQTPLSVLDGTQIINLWRASVYGLAVDYGAVDYPRLAVTSPADYSCNRTDYVSICGECHHSTDMGNFILGAAIFAGGLDRGVADTAGKGFNAGGQNDTTSAADSAGVLAGYDFASGGFNTTFNRDGFCATFRQQGSGWYDTTRNDPGCGNGRACTECNGDPTLLSIHSIPDWNAYVSTSINGYNRYSGRSPQDELIQKAPGLLEWLIEKF